MATIRRCSCDTDSIANMQIQSKHAKNDGRQSIAAFTRVTNEAASNTYTMCDRKYRTSDLVIIAVIETDLRVA